MSEYIIIGKLKLGFTKRKFLFRRNYLLDKFI